MIGCHCAVCTSADPRDKRLRSSLLMQTGTRNFVIDAGPDFRQQMLREQVDTLDAILFTHSHRDHTAGLDDIRAYNYFQEKPMDVYLTAETEQALRMEYHYVFADKWYPGLPEIKFFRFSNQPFYIDDVKFTPVSLQHYKMEVFGFRVRDFTYITDAHAITDVEKEKVKGSKTLVINALRKEKHISHFNLEEALAVIAELKPEKAFLTHLSHQMGRHADIEKDLPAGVFLAYDGLKLEV